MSADQPENEPVEDDLTVARRKQAMLRNLRDFPITPTSGYIDGVFFGELCRKEYEEVMSDECYEDEDEVWSEASKIADERDAAKRQVAELKQENSDLKTRLAGPLLKPCPTCRGDAVSCGAPGCPTCADSPVDGWVPA